MSIKNTSLKSQNATACAVDVNVTTNQQSMNVRNDSARLFSASLLSAKLFCSFFSLLFLFKLLIWSTMIIFRKISQRFISHYRHISDEFLISFKRNNDIAMSFMRSPVARIVASIEIEFRRELNDFDSSSFGSFAGVSCFLLTTI